MIRHILFHADPHAVVVRGTRVFICADSRKLCIRPRRAIEKETGMVWIVIECRHVHITLTKQAKAELTDVLYARLQGTGELMLNTEIYRAHFRVLQVIRDGTNATERSCRIRSKRCQ